MIRLIACIFFLHSLTIYGQQFVNGKLLDPAAQLNDYAFVQCNTRYLDSLKKYDTLDECYSNILDFEARQLSYSYLIDQIPGFDTLQNNGYARIFNLQVKRVDYDYIMGDLHLLAFPNVDSAAYFGWSMALNVPLDSFTPYSFQVDLGPAEGARHTKFLGPFEFDNIMSQTLTTWYLKIGVSDTSYIFGDSIGRIDNSNFLRVKEEYFNEYTSFDREDTDTARQTLKKHTFGTILNTQNKTGKFLTFEFVATPSDYFLESISAHNSNPGLLICRQYPSGRIHASDFPQIDNFELGCTVHIEDSACLDSGTLYLRTTRQYNKYQWSTGDTTASIAITDPGTYWVATDNYGCKAYDTITIEKCPPLAPVDTSTIDTYPLFIPSAITPNQDGLNDIFTQVPKPWELVSLEIYNRWGQLIYQGNKPWDGTLNQKTVSGGIYLYRLSVQNMANDQVEQRAGKLHVVR